MSATTISEGHWTYRATAWMTPFVATDRRTGQTHDTGATTIAAARAYTDALDQPAATATVQITIASGPQRARTGNQRYTKAFAA